MKSIKNTNQWQPSRQLNEEIQQYKIDMDHFIAVYWRNSAS